MRLHLQPDSKERETSSNVSTKAAFLLLHPRPPPEELVTGRDRGFRNTLRLKPFPRTFSDTAKKKQQKIKQKTRSGEHSGSKKDLSFVFCLFILDLQAFFKVFFAF